MARTRSSRSAETRQTIANNASNESVPSEAAQMASSASALKDKLERFRHHTSPSAKDVVSSAVPSAEAHAPLSRLTRKRASTAAGDEAVEPSPATTPSSPSPAPAKKRRKSSKYAPPSTYAHLPELVDVLAPNLIAVFVGTNPGVRTATAGHAYAHPSNLFWKLLHSSGCTDTRLRPEQDGDLPRLCRLGNTNLVARPSRDAAELSRAEMAAGTPILEAKLRRCRPAAVCIVGKGIWEAIWRWRHGRELRKHEFRYGWQDEAERLGRGRGRGDGGGKGGDESGCEGEGDGDGDGDGDTGDGPWEGARVFVATSTSGLSASTRPHEKEAIWKPFGEWVKQQRQERSGQNVKAEG